MAASFSQAKSTFVIPAAQPTDPESVRQSLAQAHAEFERGAVREALRLLRKAAESSDDAGDDLRALALARAAADLASEVGPTAVPPPPAPLPPPLTQAPAAVSDEGREPDLRQLLDSGRAVKVVVKRSTSDEGLYIVRRADGEPTPLGGRQAVLLLLEPDDAFFAPPKPPPAS